MTARTPLAEATGRVDLPPDAVRRALIEKFDDGYLKVEETNDRVAAQGGWWARREYALASDGRGTRVTLRVYNVATRARWAVPLVNRFFAGFRQRMRSELDETLASFAASARSANRVPAPASRLNDR